MSTVQNRPTTCRRVAAVSSAAAVMALMTVGCGSSNKASLQSRNLATRPAVSTTAIVSQSTAQAVRLNLLNGTALLALSNPATQSINHGSPDPATINTANSAALSLLNGDNFLTAGALSEDTEADSSGGMGPGSSFACAGTVAPGGAVQIGSNNQKCTRTGNGTGGLTVDLSKIPGLGGPLSGLADIKLNLNGVTAHAKELPGPGGTTQVDSGGGGVSNGSVTITLVGVTVVNMQPLNIPAAPNSNLLTSVVNGLTSFLGANPGSALVLQPIIDALSNAVTPLLELCTNYQPSLPLGGTKDCRGTVGPVVPVDATHPFSVSGIHLSLLSTAGAVGDIPRVTVGPNALAPAGPAFPTEGLPIAAGGGLLAIALIVPWYRRRRRNMSSTA